jgi:hypothetical protein
VPISIFVWYVRENRQTLLVTKAVKVAEPPFPSSNATCRIKRS